MERRTAFVRVTVEMPEDDVDGWYTLDMGGEQHLVHLTGRKTAVPLIVGPEALKRLRESGSLDEATE